MAIRVRREHLPWLALAVLACFGVLAVVGITLAGWRGEVRYAGNPVEQRPLVGPTASAAVAGERQSVPGKKAPAGAAATPGGLDAVGLASIGSGIQRPPAAEKPKIAILVTGIGLARALQRARLEPPAGCRAGDIALRGRRTGLDRGGTCRRARGLPHAPARADRSGSRRSGPARDRAAARHPGTRGPPGLAAGAGGWRDRVRCRGWGIRGHTSGVRSRGSGTGRPWLQA